MRIAAGVLIIVVAALDLVSSLGYLGFGALAAGAGGGIEAVMNQAVQEAKRKNPNITEAEIQKVRELARRTQELGSLLLIYGAFLVVMGGLGIAAGVVLFRAKAAMFALAVGILQIVADVLSFTVMLPFGITIWNILGILAGVFVIVGVLTYPKSREPAYT